jgi:hypothetical protein
MSRLRTDGDFRMNNLPENTDGPFNVVVECFDCAIAVPIGASDPQAFGPVYCPECGAAMERTTNEP